MSLFSICPEPRTFAQIRGLSDFAWAAVLVCLALLLLPVVDAKEGGDGARLDLVETLDVVYGEIDGQKLLLDAFIPESAVGNENGELRPAVVFVHGGGWSAGNKKDFRPYARQLAEQGFATFSVGYRLFNLQGDNRWPAQIDDVQRAVRWIRSKASEYGVDPQRIGAAGGSAGGHLVSLLGTVDTRDNSDPALAEYSSRVSCVVDIFGPTDMGDDFATKVEAGERVNQLVRGLFGADPKEIPAVVKGASPLAQVDKGDAAFLIFHGKLDALVPLDHSERLNAALQGVGVESKLVVFDDDGHGFQKPANRARFAEETLAFFNRHLKAKVDSSDAGGGKPGVSAALISRLESGQGEPVKIVCFGDSVTGLYYHTGGHRAYTDMVGIALQQIYPKAKIEMINAGISGHTTEQGLARMEKDVLFHRPDVVTVMFGLNDLAKYGDLEAYRSNLVKIVKRTRAAGGEPILCTPNSVKTTERRPFEKLVEYCRVVREVAAREKVALCDSFAAFEKMRADDPLAWRLTLSDEIHPNMAGHKAIAEQIAETISGVGTSLEKVGPAQPALAFTLEKLAKGEPVQVIAMPPFDSAVVDALKSVNPAATIHVTPWPTAGKTLADINSDSKRMVRPAKPSPDLVIMAIPRATRPDGMTREEWIHTRYWIVNYSLSFSAATWDLVAVHPSVFDDPVAMRADDAEYDELLRKLTAAHDVSLIDRKDGDDRGAGEIFAEWVKGQVE